MRKRCIDCLHPTAIDHDSRTDKRIEQRFNVGSTGTNMSAKRCTYRRSGTRRATSTKGQHGTTQRFRAQRFKSATTGVDAIDNNCGQGLAHRGFERGFPTCIDFNKVEHRAEHTIDAGETFGSGARTRFVERKRKRFYSCAPGVLFAFRSAMNRFRSLDCSFGLRTTNLCRFHGLDQRKLRRFQLNELGSKRFSFGQELRCLFGKCRRASANTVALFASAT